MKFYLPDGSEAAADQTTESVFRKWNECQWALTMAPYTVHRVNRSDEVLQVLTLERGGLLCYGIGRGFAEAFAAATEHVHRELREGK